LIKGYTNQQIAASLFISPRTVETHRKNLMQKLGAGNRAELIRMTEPLFLDAEGAS
ncbi:MAG: helix-turn-helix transcriptional regulator, partial [Planctomycetes bacterium]|nr:helix-turn-helix transcriptional regulator [Planctomycetota bacterium]